MGNTLPPVLILVLDVEAGEVLLQVLLDQVVGRLFGLAELRDDERKSVSQTLQLIHRFLETNATH